MESESVICACGHGSEYHDDLQADWVDHDFPCSFKDCGCEDWSPEPEPAEPASYRRRIQ